MQPFLAMDFQEWSLSWALQVLLWLHSLGVGFPFLEDVILTQLEGMMSSRTSSLVNVVRGSIAHQSSITLSMSWWGHLGLVAGLSPPNVVGPSHKPGSSESMSARSPACQIAYPGGAAIYSCPRSGVLAVQSSLFLLLMHNISPWVPKGHPDPPGKLLDIILTRNLSKFLPQGQHVYLLCVPPDPLCSSLGEGSGVKVHWGPSSSLSPARGISPPPKISLTQWSRGGGHSRSSPHGLDQSDGSPVPSSSL